MSALTHCDLRRARPPYDVDNPAFDHLHATDPEAWRTAVQLDQVAAPTARNCSDSSARRPVPRHRWTVAGVVAVGLWRRWS